MVHIIYWIGVAIMTAIYVVSATKLVKHSYQKGMNDFTLAPGEYVVLTK